MGAAYKDIRRRSPNWNTDGAAGIGSVVGLDEADAASVNLAGLCLRFEESRGLAPLPSP